MWCIGEMNADYIAQMEDILTLYAEPPNALYPVVNFDEAGKQLVEHIKAPKNISPGQCNKVDYEYKRSGVANIFMLVDRHRGWRKAKATSHKRAVDFAHCMKVLVDEDFTEASKIRVVMDNFGTHKPSTLYKAYPPEEARRILNKLEFHYTLKHASWLNMAEIAIGVMSKQCLDRHIPDMDTLKFELSAWESKRNEGTETINWMSDVDAARSKLNKAYGKVRESTHQN